MRRPRASSKAAPRRRSPEQAGRRPAARTPATGARPSGTERRTLTPAMADRDRHRRRHDRRALARRGRGGADPAAGPTASSRSTSPGRAGSSTTPTEIWDAVRATLGELCGTLDEPVAAIGITNQRETVVAWSRRTGRPLHRAIVWQDRRTAGGATSWPRPDICRSSASGPGWCSTRTSRAPRSAWLLTEGGVPAGPDLAVGTIDTWVLWNLTGGAVHATDPSNASRTMLLDIRALAWDDELADLLGVPVGALPEVRPTSGRLGVTVDGCGAPGGHPGELARRRPAGSPVRPGLLRARDVEEHLRHRLVRAHQRGPGAPAGRRRHADDGGLAAGRRLRRLRPGGLDLRDGCRDAVAARRARPHRDARPRSVRWRRR